MDNQNDRGDEPSSWQVAEALISNIRDVTRRAETDSLLFMAIIIGFIVVRSSAASSLSIIGLQVTNLHVVQFSLPPAAAFLALRYAKAQRLTVSIGMQLRSLLDHDLPSVPIAVCPPDWDVVRDVAVRMPSVSKLLSAGTSVVMFGLVVAGAVVNLVDAQGSNIPWATISGLVTALVVSMMFLSKSVWSVAVIARTHQD